MKIRYSLVIVLLFGVLVTACSTETNTTPMAKEIPVEALRSATYSGIYDSPIKLRDGLYEGEPYVEGDPSRPTVEYINGVELFGDLDGDGVEDAVVFLLERGGGSGAFTFIAAKLNRNGQPLDAGAVRIEDRIGVRSAVIEDHQIVLDLILQGPGDGACCGSHKTRRIYALQDGILADITPPGGDLVKVSISDLDGSSWRLTELGEAGTVLPDVEVTLSFEDGQLVGYGGCNRYQVGFSLGEDNPFILEVGLISSTRQACDDSIMEQEEAYFQALQGVSLWGYWYGYLGMTYYMEDGYRGQLLFEPLKMP